MKLVRRERMLDNTQSDDFVDNTPPCTVCHSPHHSANDHDRIEEARKIETSGKDLVKYAKERFQPPAVKEEKQEEEKIIGLSKFRQEMTESGRIILPYLQIVQAMSDAFSQDNVPPGNFRNSLTGEVYPGDPGIEIIPAGVFHWRRRWNRESRREILCSSNDAITGIGDPGGACKSCPLQIWHVEHVNGVKELIPNIRNYRTKKDEKLIAPPCDEQFVFPSLVLNSTWRVPGALVFHRTYLNEGLRFYAMIEWSPPDTVYLMKTIKTENEKGKWFSPKVSVLRKLKEEEINSILEFKSALRKSTGVEVSEDDVAEA